MLRDMNNSFISLIFIPVTSVKHAYEYCGGDSGIQQVYTV